MVSIVEQTPGTQSTGKAPLGLGSLRDRPRASCPLTDDESMADSDNRLRSRAGSAGLESGEGVC